VGWGGGASARRIARGQACFRSLSSPSVWLIIAVCSHPRLQTHRAPSLSAPHASTLSTCGTLSRARSVAHWDIGSCDVLPKLRGAFRPFNAVDEPDTTYSLAFSPDGDRSASHDPHSALPSRKTTGSGTHHLWMRYASLYISPCSVAGRVPGSRGAAGYISHRDISPRINGR